MKHWYFLDLHTSRSKARAVERSEKLKLTSLISNTHLFQTVMFRFRVHDWSHWYIIQVWYSANMTAVWITFTQRNQNQNEASLTKTYFVICWEFLLRSFSPIMSVIPSVVCPADPTIIWIRPYTQPMTFMFTVLPWITDRRTQHTNSTLGQTLVTLVFCYWRAIMGNITYVSQVKVSEQISWSWDFCWSESSSPLTHTLLPVGPYWAAGRTPGWVLCL